jgi:putative ABC transport system permease protein
MSGTAVATRLARREVVRRPWRSLVVLLLVVFPVVALTGLTVMLRSNDRTPAERFAERAGTEDIQLALSDPIDGFDELDAAVATLPEGASVVEFQSGWERIRTTDGRRLWGEISDRPLHHPISEGLIRRLRGRVPRTGDEVLLTSRLATALDVAVGDTLELDRPTDYAATVVGIGEWGTDLNATRMVVGAQGDHELIAGFLPTPVTNVLIDLPPSAEQDPDLLGPFAMADADLRHPSLVPQPEMDSVPANAQTAIVWTWVGGAVAFTILGVVIAAAFAVTARRQLRLIGQLMGNGADDRTLRATLFLQGTVIGVIGGALGIAAALVGLHLFQPVIEQIIARRLDGFDVQVGDLLPIWAIAIVAATGAAVLPARSAVRTSVLQALAGRRPVGPYPARLVARGAAAAVGRLVLLAVATMGASGDGTNGTGLFVLTGIVGSVAMLLGTCAMAPAIIARLEPLAGSLRGTARLAARSVARQRSRTGAVVAAIAVVAAGAVAGSTAWITSEGTDDTSYEQSVPDDVVVLSYDEYLLDDAGVEQLVTSEPPAELVDRVAAAVPGAQRVPTRRAVAHSAPITGPYRYGSSFAVVDEAYADAFDLDPAIRTALGEGAVATVWEGGGRAPDHTEETVIVDELGNEVATAPTIDFPALPGPLSGLPLVAPSTAESLGLQVVEGPVALHAPSTITADQRDRLADLSDDLDYDYGTGDWRPGEVSTVVWLFHPYESFELSAGLITAGVVGAATLFSLAVVALGLALSAAETKDERDVLAAIGAQPSALRRLAAAKAAVLSATGMLIGVPLGFIPMVVVLRAASVNRTTSITPLFPWVQVALLVVVVPIIATLATLAASGIALRLRPVRASTMAFD